MFEEYKIVDGVLSWRSSPDEAYMPMYLDQITTAYKNMKDENIKLMQKLSEKEVLEAAGIEEVSLPPKSKYHKEIKPGVWVDVYDVLAAFQVKCPAMAHAIKKCLMPGLRGSKGVTQDKAEAIASINRSIELQS